MTGHLTTASPGRMIPEHPPTRTNAAPSGEAAAFDEEWLRADLLGIVRVEHAEEQSRDDRADHGGDDVEPQ